MVEQLWGKKCPPRLAVGLHVTCSRHPDHFDNFLETFLAPAVDMLVILAAPQPPKPQNHQRIGSQFNCHDAGSVSTAPQQLKCQKHQRMDRRLFAVCRALAGSGRTARKHTNIRRALPTSEDTSRKVVQLPFLGHWTVQYQREQKLTEVLGRPVSPAFCNWLTHKQR